MIRVAFGPSLQQFRKWGAVFHGTMDAAMQQAGAAFPAHDDDDGHNIAVGQAIWLFQSGRWGEAERFYNDWAGAHGFPRIKVVRVDPLQIDVGLEVGGMIADFDCGEPRILTVGDWTRAGFARRGGVVDLSEGVGS